MLASTRRFLAIRRALPRTHWHSGKLLHAPLNRAFFASSATKSSASSKSSKSAKKGRASTGATGSSPLTPGGRNTQPTAPVAGRKAFPADEILPCEYGHVRVISNTTRDAQQSNLSASMADEHRQHLGRLVNDVYKDMDVADGRVGYEQTWGGTVPMFDVWKRGVQPFAELREMSEAMPDTPASALIRSNGLNALGSQPADVVDEFIRLAAINGVNVFTNFDAHNDPRNHRLVAEAVHKHGGHYQAAVSWAVFQQDPTVYNVRWAVDFFRELMPLEPHSLYVKDPAGVLTPEMAGVLAAEIKEAFPHLPLVFHTHYQTGFGYMTYLKAVENGANGVECSAGLADGAGQPSSLTMLRTFEDFGFNTGNPNKEALTKIEDYCREIRMLYEAGRVPRTPDVRVEMTGIAGGQRTILDQELIDANQPHLIPQVDVKVQEVRLEGGAVCQVTPVADSYAREAMRRLRGGDPGRDFAPGYASILTGEGGLVKEPVDEDQRRVALDQRAEAYVASRFEEGALDDRAFDLVRTELLPAARAFMDDLARAVHVRARLHEVSTRIEQLHELRKKPALLESLERKIAAAHAADPKLSPVRDLAGRLDLLESEKLDLQDKLKQLESAGAISDDDYEQVLRANPPKKVFDAFTKQAAVKEALDAEVISTKQLADLLSMSGFVHVPVSELMAPGLESARKDIEDIENEHVLGLTEDPREMEELVMVQAMYKNAAIPNLALNFFKNYKMNPSFWPPTYDRAEGETLKLIKDQPLALKRNIHAKLEKVIGMDALRDLVAKRKQVSLFQERLALVRGNSHVSEATRQRLEDKIQSLEKQFAELRKDAAAKVADEMGSQGLVSSFPRLTRDGSIQYDELDLTKIVGQLINETVAHRV